MKSIKLILAVFSVAVLFNCSAENIEESLEVEKATSDITFTDSTSNEPEFNNKFSNTGNNNSKFYRITFNNSTTNIERVIVGLNFSSSVNSSRVLKTTNPYIQIWEFLNIDTIEVDNFITNNSLTIEDVEPPSVIKITYAPTVTEIVKNEIKSNIGDPNVDGTQILITINTYGQNETWVFKNCCVSGDACNKIANFYSNSIISDVSLQN